MPDERERRALTCLAEFWHLHDRAGDDVWPGWRPREHPLALCRRDGTLFLSGHPARPTEAEEVFLPVGVEGPAVYRLRGLPEGVAAGPTPVVFLGVPTAFVPLEEVAAGEEAAVEFVSLLARESFRCFLQRWGKLTPPSPLVVYPDDQPVNNALGNIEGHLLLEAHRAAEDQVREVALAFALIRRERRAQLEDEQVQYERYHETQEGLAMYAAVRLLEEAAAPGYEPSAGFERLVGGRLPDLARGAVERRLEALRTINRKGLGATRRRFFYTGLGLALLLDRLRPGWKDELRAPGVWMDTLLDASVSFDGGERDDHLIAEVEFRYDYVSKLREEREHTRTVRRRKEELIAQVLRGPGRVFVFDVSDLYLTGVQVDDDRLETIGERLRIHTGRASFRYGQTVLDFEGVPVIEDRHNGLIEVRLPGRLTFLGDGNQLRVLRPTEFTEGLELQVDGVRVRARQGFIQPVGDAVYVKIFR